MEPHILLTESPLDPEALRRSVEDPSLGGVVVFCGEVRSVTEGAPTVQLEYEAYKEMALAQMRILGEEAMRRWNGRVALAHRTGTLLPGEIAVVTVAACAHRAEAFACCQFLIDRIKADVPIWKREG
ncbi:MAG: molybdenum cofactor biosynthesis protein MoaE [Fimbriimonadaceae bacterium]|nr:molybdenum cofactor biosynthesis protein MoaE [Fimbriimonadaceae bacterium]